MEKMKGLKNEAIKILIKDKNNISIMKKKKF